MYVRWTKWLIINFLIVSVAGTLLRLKILMPLPQVNYRFLLYGHSHFALGGWVSLALFVILTSILHPESPPTVYRRLFQLGQLSAYGMLLTFPFMGYQGPSIAFSVLNIVFSYGFAVMMIIDLRRSTLSLSVRCWWLAGLLFYVVSSAGPYYLAWLMVHHNGSQDQLIGALYFFLHFLYNGWFLFALLGIYFYNAQSNGMAWPEKSTRFLFWILALATVPGYFMNLLWMQLPPLLYGLAISSAVLIPAALLSFKKTLLLSWKKLKSGLSPATRVLWTLSFAAFMLKLLLQLLSTVPALGHYAFGIRAIVIGYLHLVLLAFISLFLLGQFSRLGWIDLRSATGKRGYLILIGGILLNELLLMLQGLAAIAEDSLPYSHEGLLLASVIIMVGIGQLVFSAKSPASR